MDKTYQPHAIEQRWYQHWENQGYFAPQGDGEAYCVMIPPPNVTGRLHMGHGFQNTIMDALVRYHRMRGFNTLWQVGTDHAGISTQMVVERQLLAQNISRHDLGRDQFIEKIWQWKAESGGHITRQLRRLGASVDWSRERFTLDEGLSNAVKTVFVRLHEEGIIYRGQRLVNWDPVLQTAISDLEVENIECDGHLWHMRYPIVGSDQYLVVATTRPETLFGDTAVAVNPNDPRYQHLIGQQLHLPLCARTIPIIADDYVDAEFGSGCVKITPAHDVNDYEVGQRHDLPMINILNKDASLNEQVPEAYQGLDRLVAREQVIAELEAQGLLERVEDYHHSVPHSDRSGAVVEPYLTYQWFVDNSSLVDKAIAAVKDGDIPFYPDNWQKLYFHWLDNIQDWCISRQIWWGHRIPAWYDEHGDCYVGFSEQAVRDNFQLDESVTLRQESDVLDTWFSSALWPFSTLGWPEKTADLSTYYPTNVLVTGFDIIFFWVARMIMMGLKFIDAIPFKAVYMTGLILDKHGQKMSKSKGNVIDPIDLIDGISLEDLTAKRTEGMMQPQKAAEVAKRTQAEYPNGIDEHGTDALRFTFCALATPGREIRFDFTRLSSNRNFCNKLWNAARYVLLNCDHQDCQKPVDDSSYSLADRWILSRLQHTIQQVHAYFANYRFDLMAHCLYDLTKSEFCDWYLELSKPVLFDGKASHEQQQATRYCLLFVLDTILKLLHPLMPFITEEIWQRLKPLTQPATETIMLAAFPQFDASLIDEASIVNIEWIKQVISGIRNIRGEMNISPAKPVPVLVHKANLQDQQLLKANKNFLLKLAKLSDITEISEGETLPQAATCLVGNMQLLIPLAGLIDVQAEATRLKKQLTKLEKEQTKLSVKLGNENFIAKAPAHVVAKEKASLSALLEQIHQLHDKLATL